MSLNFFKNYRLLSIAGNKDVIDVLTHVSGSFIISAFSSNLYTLFLTFGVMAGAAQSFVFIGGASGIYSYFKQRSGLATSK